LRTPTCSNSIVLFSFNFDYIRKIRWSSRVHISLLLTSPWCAVDAVPSNCRTRTAARLYFTENAPLARAHTLTPFAILDWALRVDPTPVFTRPGPEPAELGCHWHGSETGPRHWRAEMAAEEFAWLSTAPHPTVHAAEHDLGGRLEAVADSRPVDTAAQRRPKRAQTQRSCFLAPRKSVKTPSSAPMALRASLQHIPHPRLSPRPWFARVPARYGSSGNLNRSGVDVS
jgi:hypothetical protein